MLFLWRLTRLRAPATGVGAVLVMVPLAWLAWTTGTIYHPWSWLLRIGAGFLAGALTCLTVRRLRPRPAVDRVATGIALLAAGGIVVGLAGIPRIHAVGSGQTGMAVVVLFPVLVGGLALSTRGPSRLLAARLAVHGGRISYSLYLVHVPVLEVLWTAMAVFPALHPGRPVYVVAVVLALVLIPSVAHLSYRWLEEPARRALRSRGPGAWARREPVARRRIAEVAAESGAE